MERVARERGRWQLINVAVPVLLSILGGVLFFVLRRRRYAHSA